MPEYPGGMGVIGHWRRSALGAGGVALLLPVGLALGLLLTTALGGHNALHALGQAFSGPTEPGVHGRVDAPGLESAREVPAIPLPHPRHRRGIVRVPAAASAPTASPAPRTPAARTPSTGAPTRPSHKPAPSAGTVTTPQPQPAPTPQPPQPPQHSAVHNAAQHVADTAGTLPAPVGPAAASAVQTVVDLIP